MEDRDRSVRESRTTGDISGPENSAIGVYDRPQGGMSTAMFLIALIIALVILILLARFVFHVL